MSIFAEEKKFTPPLLANLCIVAFTHQNFGLQDLGKLIIPVEERGLKMVALKTALDLEEIFYIGTCNRVELVLVSHRDFNPGIISSLIHQLNPEFSDKQLEEMSKTAGFFQGFDALEHLIRVSCSLESMVVGEKEILAQVRSDYDFCRRSGLTGDVLRMVMNCVVKAAKEVYTHTLISQKPISVVSLAYRKLRAFKTPLTARVLLIGSGKTNTLFSKYLVKHGYHNFTIFNRTLENARPLATELDAEAFSLDQLDQYTKGFDLLITCTGSGTPIISPELYSKLLAGDKQKKIVIDLALPSDLDPSVLDKYSLHYIDMAALQEIARRNQLERLNELSQAEKIILQNIEDFKPNLQARKVELAMKEVPRKIREIRIKAVESVFVKDLEGLDAESRKTLEKVLNYMEKKYISLPMIMAKEIMGKA